MLNKSKGNMYGFVTHTWNPIKGKCSHDCNYCYMKRWGELPPIRLDAKEMRTNLGKNNFIFVGSSTDIFADDVPQEWILKVLDHCFNSPKNQYLFQTKNPARFRKLFPFILGINVLLATTIETNRHLPEFMKNSPAPEERAKFMTKLHCKKMITIEPIMDFDLDILVGWMKDINPVQVAIGADSKRSGLPEPTLEKTMLLINELEKITKIVIKPNLKRIIGKA